MTVRRIGCVGDVHGALGSLRAVLRYLRTRDVEGVLLTGDFGRGPWNADPALGNTASPEEILTLVTSVFSDVLLVPGNHDDRGLGGEISVDRRETSWLGWRVAGIGGSPYTGGGFPYEWSDATADFSSFPRSQPEILLAHSPPAGAGLDVTASGKAVGSTAIRTAAERIDGLLVCGHIHEAVGLSSVGECLCYNAGSLGEPFGAVQCGVATFDEASTRWQVDHIVLPRA
ncbi:MAG TPA: metallophosphoesterase [Gemmatimonadaceae bacterium]|nr:metallophosphoesterase [Gemmatimonadaceae bacterium]